MLTDILQRAVEARGRASRRSARVASSFGYVSCTAHAKNVARSLTPSRDVQASSGPVQPRFSFKRKQVEGNFVVTPVDCVVTDSYRLFKQREIIADLKEAVCRVLEAPLNEQEIANIPSAPYELPDGKTLEVGIERYKVPELLFNPALLSTLPVPPELAGKEAALKGLTAMANESINKCDIDLKKDFLLGVLVTVRSCVSLSLSPPVVATEGGQGSAPSPSTMARCCFARALRSAHILTRRAGRRS